MLVRKRRLILTLDALMVLFVCRTGAQLLQLFAPVRWLPSFDRWQSGALDYRYLLLSQLIVITVGGYVVRLAKSDKLKTSKRRGRLLLALGLVYFMSMLARGVLGLTILSDRSWFVAYLPILFHLVLASWILTLSRYHFVCSSNGN